MRATGRSRWRLWSAWLAACLAAGPADAITIEVDYGYDTSQFFGVGNPQGPAAGAQARAALEAAAGYFTAILDDSFSPISVPAPFLSGVSDGIVTWQWTSAFNHPSTGNPVSLAGQTLAADEYVVFAGARNLSSTGLSSPGGYSWTTNFSGSFSFAEVAQINSITNAFQDQVERRGESSGFARWGGTVSFDTIPPTPWHFDHSVMPSAGSLDFYSVALHELAHSLGFGASNEWDQWVTGLAFHGPNAQASYGAAVPLADAGHWAGEIASVVFGGSASQAPLMSSVAPNGLRTLFTDLDGAGMTDIGWTIVPEPASAVLLFIVFVARGAAAVRSCGDLRYRQR